MRLVSIAIGWTLGIIIAANVSAFVPLFWLMALGIAALLLAFGRHSSKRLWLFALMALAVAGYRYQLVPQTSDLAQYNSIGGATIEGIIIDEPDIRDDRIQVRLAVEHITFGAEDYPTSGLLLVNAPRTSQIAYGDRLIVTGQLTTPAEFDTFSYADFLARQGVFTVMNNAIVEVTAQGEGIAFYGAIYAFKADLQTLIAQALPEPQAALLTGILLGNERGIDPQLSADFSRVGASHVIAISGFNMALIAGILQGILGKFFQRRKWIAVVLGILVLALYTLLVGANAAVLRAFLMSSLLVMAPLLRRKTYVPASLAFVLLLLSFFDPNILWNISFQLSFFAVLGISLFTNFLTKWFNRLLAAIIPRRLLPLISGILNEPIVVSLAALSLTLPIIVLYFQRLSLVSLMVNLLIVPIQPLLLVLGGFALILALLSPELAQIFFWLDMLLLSWTISIVRLFAKLPYADVAFSVDYRLITFLYITVIGMAIVNATRPPLAIRLARWIRLRPIFNAIILSGSGLVLLLMMVYLSRPDGNLHFWFLDVGHSNAVLIQSPSGAQILVDGGRFPSRLLTQLGDRMPFYDRTIELLVISQPDEVDTGALTAVLNRYNTPLVFTNGQANLSDSYQALETAIASTNVVAVRAGYRAELSDGTVIEVLNPQSQPEINAAINDVALVLRVTYGDVSFLLSSDLSQEGQISILESGQYPLASVMQLPQHGTSRSLSAEFLAAVQPQVVIWQGDENNQRGDPNRDVLASLGDSPIFGTEEGTRHLWIDGHTLWIE